MANEAAQKKFAPVICLSVSLSSCGTRLVESAGYFDALNHLGALTQYDAARPRSKLSYLRKVVEEISSAIDAYEVALPKSDPSTCDRNGSEFGKSWLTEDEI